MKHKFNIPNIGVSLLTRKGLPFPGALTGVRPAGTYKGDAQEDYEVEPEAPEAEEFIRGTRLRGKDRLGRWYFMPVSFYLLFSFRREKDTGTGAGGNQDGVSKENIVETPLVGRKGAVRELISSEDLKFPSGPWHGRKTAPIPLTGLLSSGNSTT